MSSSAVLALLLSPLLHAAFLLVLLSSGIIDGGIVAVKAQTSSLCSTPGSGCRMKPAAFDTTYSTSVDASVWADPASPFPACLSGDANFTTVLKEVGALTVARSWQPYLILDNWISSLVTNSIAGILMREVLGYNYVPAPFTWEYGDLLCCSQALVSFESWTDRLTDGDEVLLAVQRGAVGYEGVSNMYIPRFLADAYPYLTSFQNIKLPEYLNLFPPAFSTPCEKMLVNESLGCVDGNYICQTNLWTNTTCDRAWYVPPQCQGPEKAKYCREFYHADPTWDDGFFEGLIRVHGLNITVAYVGLTNLMAMVINATDRKVPILYYGWEPDPFSARLNPLEISFKRPTLSCFKKLNPDPTLNQADCSYRALQIQKIMRRAEFKQDIDFQRFFTNFELQAEELQALLRDHESAGGSSTAQQLACDWVKGNFATWKNWVQNTPPPTQAPSVGALSEALPAWAIGVIVVASVAVVVGGASAAAITMLHSGRRDNSCAPKDGSQPIAVVFTDIQSSTALWAAVPEDMAPALDAHHAILRDVIRTHGGYEVKTIGDSFMVAVGSPDAAVRMAVDMQEALYSHPWGTSSIDDAYKEMLREAEAGDSTHPKLPTGERYDRLWRGLRVRIGIHYGTCEVKHDEVTKGYDYYGTTINTAARVEDAGHGGQIVMTADAYRALSEATRASVGIVSLGAQSLRGLTEPVELLNVAGPRFAERQFPALRSGSHDDAGEVADAASGGGSDTDSLSTASAVHSPFYMFLTTALSPMKPADRLTILKMIATHWRLKWTEMSKPELTITRNARLVAHKIGAVVTLAQTRQSAGTVLELSTSRASAMMDLSPRRVPASSYEIPAAESPKASTAAH